MSAIGVRFQSVDATPCQKAFAWRKCRLQVGFNLFAHGPPIVVVFPRLMDELPRNPKIGPAQDLWCGLLSGAAAA